LERYDAALAAVRDCPLLVLVRRRPGRRGFLFRSTRSRLLLRFFVATHVRSRTQELRRAYLHGAALHPTDPSYGMRAEQIAAYQQTVPRTHSHAAGVAAIVAVFLIAFLGARYVVPPFDPTMSSLYLSNAHKVDFSPKPLERMTRASLTLQPDSLVEALGSFRCGDHRNCKNQPTVASLHQAYVNVVASLLLLGVSVWIALAIPLTSFRLKRLLFDADALVRDRDLTRFYARDQYTRARGIYRFETALFRALGRKPPRELPLDLVAHASLMILLAWAAALAFVGGIAAVRYDVHNGAQRGDQLAIFAIFFSAVFLASVPAARLRSLLWVASRRAADAAGEAHDPRFLRASVRRRLVAHLIDLTIVLVLVTIVQEGLHSKSEGFWIAYTFLWPPLAAAALCTVWPFFTHFSTPGRMATQLEVRRSDGENVGRRRLLVRDALFKGFLFGPPWLLLAPAAGHLGEVSWGWLVVAAPVYLFPFSFALFSWRKTPLHDLLVDTVVVHAPHAAREEVPAVALAR
jgi:hypothetical protein